MATALHPQTQLTFKFDNQILPRKYGFPMKCRIPTKLGFKNPKYITAMYVQNNDAGGYWENQGYNWFSGLLARPKPAPRRRRSSIDPGHQPPGDACTFAEEQHAQSHREQRIGRV